MSAKNPTQKNVEKKEKQKKAQPRGKPRQRKPRVKGDMTKLKSQQIRVEAPMSIITPAGILVKGQGVLDNIDVPTRINPVSFQLMPCGLVSLALSRGATDAPFAVYEALYMDFGNLLQGNIGGVVSRLDYMNHILGSLIPKTVRYRLDGTISYSIANNNILGIAPTSDIPLPSTKNYYMYVPAGGIVFGIWQEQSPPGPYTPQQITKFYMAGMQAIAGQQSHTKFMRDSQLAPTYLNDVSAYARYSSYYGLGGGVGSPAGSTESEVPFKSRLLGVLQAFSTSTTRASRVLEISSGDSCSNFAIGALDMFPTGYYKGAVPPIFKFLDIAELAYILAASLVDAINSKRAAGVVPEEAFLWNGFSFSYSQFLIMLRQQVVWMFADSQALGQFLSNHEGSGSFIAFVMGSNCCAIQPATVMRIDSITNENLRNLKMAVRPYVTKKFKNPNNHITHVPVWGAMSGYEPINISYLNLLDNPQLLFAPEVPNTPDIWDGSDGMFVIDFNRTISVNTWAQEWNEFMDACKNVLGATTPMGGDSLGSPFLQFTRFVQYIEIDQEKKGLGKEIVSVPRRGIPRSVEPYIVEKDVEIVTLERKNSKKEMRKAILYAPPNNSVFSEFTVAITGLVPITATHKEFFTGLILPVQEVVADEAPSITEVQSFTQEPFKISMDTSVNLVFAARYSELNSAVPDRVIGLAGRPSEYAKFMSIATNSSAGGVLGDLLSVVGGVSGALGIPGLPQVANAASGLANMFGI